MNIELYQKALGFAACAHKNQKRKYTGEPYVQHCINVARLVAQYADACSSSVHYKIVAAAMMHDTIEDTDVTVAHIEEIFTPYIASLVQEVTDASKPGQGNRKVRKQIDREHLAKSSPEGATIKLADLIDNTSSIVKYDKDFAKIYLEEKALLLPLLKHGPAKLWALAYETLQDAQAALVQHSLSPDTSGD